MLHEMWLQRLFLWLTGLPCQILCSAHTGWAGMNLCSLFQCMCVCVCVCVLCCQLFHAVGNPTVLRHKKLTPPYGTWWRCLTTCKCYVLCFFAHSVASAMTSETAERYERLTSVSSSVDIEQRDTVSITLLSQGRIYYLIWDTLCIACDN